jgi:DNA-binding transcriptional MerR regulator
MDTGVTSQKDLVSIKEFAEIAGVKQSLLRYYDDIGLFKPIYRGENSYRYYSLQQIQTIKLITTLQTLKVSLKDIEGVLSHRDPDIITRLLTKHEIALNKELIFLQESYSIIHSLRTMIEESEFSVIGDVKIKFMESHNFSLGPLNEYGPEDSSYHKAYSKFYRAAHDLRISLDYSIGGYFDSFDGFLANPSRPERFFSDDPRGCQRSFAGHYLVVYSRGSYGDMGNLPELLMAFCDEHGLKNIGPVYQIYIINEVSEMDPTNYLLRTSVFIPNMDTVNLS